MANAAKGNEAIRLGWHCFASLAMTVNIFVDLLTIYCSTKVIYSCLLRGLLPVLSKGVGTFVSTSVNLGVTRPIFESFYFLFVLNGNGFFASLATGARLSKTFRGFPT